MGVSIINNDTLSYTESVGRVKMNDSLSQEFFSVLYQKNISETGVGPDSNTRVCTDVISAQSLNLKNKVLVFSLPYNIGIGIRGGSSANNLPYLLYWLEDENSPHFVFPKRLLGTNIITMSDYFIMSFCRIIGGNDSNPITVAEIKEMVKKGEIDVYARDIKDSDLIESTNDIIQSLNKKKWNRVTSNPINLSSLCPYPCCGVVFHKTPDFYLLGVNSGNSTSQPNNIYWYCERKTGRLLESLYRGNLWKHNSQLSDVYINLDIGKKVASNISPWAVEDEVYVNDIENAIANKELVLKITKYPVI